MQKYQDVVLNQNGNPVSGVQVTVTDLAGSPVAVYSSNAIGLNVNPLTSDNNGRFSFYAPDGRYSLTFTFGGNVVASISDILLEDPMDGSDAVFNDVTMLGSLSDASKITSAAVGGISATNVQAALAELDSDKASNADLSLKVNSADLAASGGSALVGYDGGTAQDVLDDAKPMANYTALRNYTGRATSVRITQAGLAGFFQRDDADTTSADNGGTIIVDASGRRWKRLFAGAVNVKWFGAVGDGVTDDTVAIQAAIPAVSSVGGGRVYFPRGTYKVASALTVPSNVVLTGEGKRNTKLLRTFTGDFITSFGGYAGIEYLTIDGQTATHGSGRGVVMSGATPNSFMLQAEVTNFSQACLEFGANAGSTFRAMQCDFYTTGAVGTVAAIRVNGTDTAATSRHFTDCESGGCTLYDFGGANDVYVSGGYTNGLIFGAASSKVMATNIRIGAGAGDVTIAGGGHQITNCVFSSSVTLTCTNSNFDCQVPGYNITDSGAGNAVFIKSISYTPTWTATGGGASLGDGSIKGRWSRQGDVVDFQIDLTLGSTSAVGSGVWEFTLPIPDTAFSPVQMCGVGFASNAAASASTVFAVRVTPGAQKVQGLYAVTGTGAPSNLGASAPAATWGAGTTVRFSGRYYVP